MKQTQYKMQFFYNHNSPQQTNSPHQNQMNKKQSEKRVTTNINNTQMPNLPPNAKKKKKTQSKPIINYHSIKPNTCTHEYTHMYICTYEYAHLHSSQHKNAHTHESVYARTRAHISTSRKKWKQQIEMHPNSCKKPITQVIT